MENVDPRYSDGSYHSAVFTHDALTERVVAERRATKLQRLIVPTDTVLEVGVGTCLNLARLRCAKKVGYDVTNDLEQRCAAHGVEPCADLANAGTFDVVLAHHVLEHTRDPMACLREWGSHVKPGGKLLIYVPLEFNRRYRSYKPGDPNMHLFSWNSLTLGNLVTAAGFKVESVRVMPYGYEQRLARLTRFGQPVYLAALATARFLRPCDEIELVARV